MIRESIKYYPYRFFYGLLIQFLIIIPIVSCGPSNEVVNLETKEHQTKNGEPSVLKLEGHYQGKNLYVQNPYHPNNMPCVYKVTLNGELILDSADLAFSAFEIDLKGAGMQMGEAVVLKIYHHKDCMPKVLNPEVR